MVVRLEELLDKKPLKPKFIPREKRKKNLPQKVGAALAQEFESARHEQPAPSKLKEASPFAAPRLQSKKQPGYFSFNWDESEDTLVPTSSVETQDLNLPEWRREKESEVETTTNTDLQQTWETKPDSAMTERDWRIMYQDLGITSDAGVRPLRKWTELDSAIVSIVHSLKYLEPTPIQRATIPLAIKGGDVIGVAETGSGKTASFVIPLVLKLQNNAQSSIAGLILAPTRELALQIETELVKFARPFKLKTAALVGGRSMQEQADEVADGVDVVVATPGRLTDFLNQNLLSLNNCRQLVLDEADRMIDMGFEEQVREILLHLPESRQTLMYTATWPPAIRGLASQYLKNPETVTVARGDVNDRVRQKVEFLQASDRLARLSSILHTVRFPIIVFANLRTTVDTIEQALLARGLSVASMHGAKSQDQRETVLQDLKDGKTNILIATDVAGRGIDIPDVALVVNYEMPRSIDTYVHRIGRTGRAGRSGEAITFVGDEDSSLFSELKEVIRKGGSKVPDFLREPVTAGK